MSERQFLRTLRHFNTAMLVTRNERNELRSRPMALAEVTNSACLWFMSRLDTAKVDELAARPDVNIAMQGDHRFLSITGTARVHRSREKAEALWHGMLRAWFPDGPEDPSLALIEVESRIAEYWDRSGIEALRFVLAEPRAAMSGRPLDEDSVGKHDKVVLYPRA